MTKKKAAAVKQKPVIADPEGQNGDRAGWAMDAVEAFQGATGLGEDDGLDTAILDLLADLGHLCDREGLSLVHLLGRAKDHYTAETMDDDGNVTGKQFEEIYG